MEIGSLTPCLTAQEALKVQRDVEIERKNGFGPDVMQYLNREQTLKIEPSLGPDVIGALYHPKTASINPKKLLKAIYKRCVIGGVKMQLKEHVTNITYFEKHDLYSVETNGNIYFSKQLVIAAGA